jgi:hypothetical protein
MDEITLPPIQSANALAISEPFPIVTGPASQGVDKPMFGGRHNSFHIAHLS